MLTIAQALEKLDPKRDEHWTVDGLPRCDVVTGLMGREVTVTRREITEAAPMLTRESVRAPGSGPVAMPPEPEKVPTQPSAVEADPAFVDAQDPVVGMSEGEVLRSPLLIERALAEFERQAAALMVRAERIKQKLLDLGRRSDLLNRHLDRMRQNGQAKSQTGVQDYLQRSKDARAARAERARRFIDAGTTAKDVAAELRTQSPIDAALSARKPGQGTQRPSYPVTPQAG